MAIRYETVKHEELTAQTQRVFGKIALGSERSVLQDVFAVLLKGGKEGAPRVIDLLRIAGVVEVDVPANWRPLQAAILTADAELEAKQQRSAADSREAGAKKRRLRKEQEERDAADRLAFERWKRSHSRKPPHPDPSEEDGLEH